jgi:hypothetical protein
VNTWRILYHMMRADFFERTRRYSFLVTLLTVMMLGYWVNNGTISLMLDTYRGIYNSAWVGSLMALVIVTFLGWFGFYLVKNAVERDEETGVGQIIATTPLTRVEYTMGKWLSNFVLLAAFCLILMAAAIIMQIFQREDPIFDLWALVAPFLFVVLPVMALVAAFAIFFEMVPWLRGGFGNVVYFFFFMFLLSFAIISFGEQYPEIEPFGIRLLTKDMAQTLQQIDPTYNPENFTLGTSDRPMLGTFHWTGLKWTPQIVALRLMWIAISAGLAATAGLIFNRFDTSTVRRMPMLGKSRRRAAQGENAGVVAEDSLPAADAPTSSHLSSLGEWKYQPNFARLLLAEARLMFKGQRWYWYAGAAVIIIGCLVAPLDQVRQGWLLAAAIWPVFLWSQMGVRENRWRMDALVFSTPRPLLRVLLVSWLAGVLLGGSLSIGAAVRWMVAGDLPSMLAWVLFILFIPSLALFLGVWSSSTKLFEVLYLVIWYIGPVNRLPGLDYLGVLPDGLARTQPVLLAVISLALLIGAVLGRKRQI